MKTPSSQDFDHSSSRCKYSIDLISIDLIEQTLALRYTMVTTDFILEELRAEQRSILLPFIADGRFTISRGNEDTVVEIAALFDQYPALSFADCSALLYARQHSALLLTGDRQLRKTALASQVEVHGILWILEQLVAHRIVTTLTAAERLELLMQSNVRLPVDECRRLIDRWK